MIKTVECHAAKLNQLRVRFHTTDYMYGNRPYVHVLACQDWSSSCITGTARDPTYPIAENIGRAWQQLILMPAAPCSTACDVEYKELEDHRQNKSGLAYVAGTAALSRPHAGYQSP